MNGPEHFLAAERLIGHGRDSNSTPEARNRAIAAAQVHATLALAAETATRPSALFTEEFRTGAATQWAEVAS